MMWKRKGKYNQVLVKESDHPEASEWGIASSGFVYLVRFGAKVKIGKTRNPYSRLQELQIKQKKPFDDLHLITCDVCENAERGLHLRLTQYCIGYEWFILPDIIISEIKSYRSYINGEYYKEEYVNLKI